MKRTFPIPLLFCLLLFGSCSSGTKDMAAVSKVDILLEQLKKEPKFTEYLRKITASIAILDTGLRKVKPEDSLYIRDPKIPLDEKIKKYGLTDMDNKIKENMKKSNEMLSYLHTKYPAFGELTQDESKTFYKKAIAFFNKSEKITQHEN